MIPVKVYNIQKSSKFIIEDDYLFEHSGKNFLIKFKKENFGYNLEIDDDIKIEGDIQVDG